MTLPNMALPKLRVELHGVQGVTIVDLDMIEVEPGRYRTRAVRFDRLTEPAQLRVGLVDSGGGLVWLDRSDLQAVLELAPPEEEDQATPDAAARARAAASAGAPRTAANRPIAPPA